MEQKTFRFLLGLVVVAAVITFLYGFYLLRKIKLLKVKDEKIAEISSYIKEGTIAFLKREYFIIVLFILGISVFLALLGFIPILQNAEGIGYKAALAFLTGAFLSGGAGFIGMLSGIKSNGLTTEAAKDHGMSKALNRAFSGGAVLGLAVSGFGLFGLSAMFFLFYHFTGDVKTAAQVVTGYGLGASLVALFARVGGGIYTKAADVGADLVGKIEADIPEDDPRNPAVIADNVGDNVGDIAGMGSDLLESYVGSIISALTLGAASLIFLESVIFPLLVAALGVLAGVISIVFIRLKDWKHPQKTLNIATYTGTFIVIVGSFGLSYFIFKNFKPFISVFVGVLAGILIGLIAEIYTSDKGKHVKEVSRQSETGHATNIIAGYSVGMRSTTLTILVLVGSIIISYLFNDVYGIALAAVGMLSTVGVTVAVDAYGPISDNAGGIAQMADLDHHVREITDELDSVGNTTAAIGKGFCIGSATLTSLALFASFAHAAGLNQIDVLSPLVLSGILVGAMLPFLFTSLVINSVGRAAHTMIEEVRRQFTDDPGILAGTSKADYKGCVDIATRAALREMIIPTVIAVLAPILTGFLFGAAALGGLLIGALASASMLAIFMANSGGAWDNAKKLIESGEYGGRGTEAHKAAITGDTVGDPFKDTAGPTMDILIKLMSIIALIIGPVLLTITSLFERFF
ncbi:MAG: sodium-translocating pyrophosphatase [Acholeplasmataceae bacterium]|nr:sodium-translocating pyrophosphatase [Acholeplasmataceae bacterium]